MVDKPIDLLAKIRTNTRRSGAQNAYIEITAPELNINIDDKSLKEYGRTVAEAIRETIANGLAYGKAPDGSPLPTVEKSTTLTREWHEQAYHGAHSALGSMKGEGRGGMGPRRSAEHRKAAIANIKGGSVFKRFNAPRLGRFDPGNFDNTTFGRESGMLARSIVVVFGRGAWLLKFAGPRSEQDGTGGSAVTRVFSRVKLWTAQCQKQPRVQEALQAIRGALVARRGLEVLKALASVVKEAQRTEQTLEGMGEGE